MSSTVLAGRLDLTTGKFAMETVAIPEPGPDEVRIKVSAAGICLSDIHLIDGTLRLEPRAGLTRVTLGHEPCANHVLDGIRELEECAGATGRARDVQWLPEPAREELREQIQAGATDHRMPCRVLLIRRSDEEGSPALRTTRSQRITS